MFGSRRPGKRSIVGTRVCAIFHDGLYRPGVIHSVHISTIQTVPQTYTVTFDEGGTSVFTDNQLIGPGFQSLSKSNLNVGQTVYITHNNREVKGQILGSNSPDLNSSNAPKYWLVGIGDELDTQVKVKFDDIRLLESRKSARLSDQDTDYVKMADLPFQESKKRTNFIDVPDFSAKQCKSNHVYAKREDLHISRDIEMEVMDENMAAMVLTSLSCSPVSPRIVGNFNEISHLTNGSHHQGDSDGVNSNSTLTQCSGNSSPSDSILSQSAPSNIFSFSINEDKQFSHFGFSRTVYQCTWPGCKQIYNTCPGIEKHIRIEHLGPQNVSDHEEDFYYSEIEVMMDSYHNDSPTSPTLTSLSHNFVNPTPDHNYQRRETSNMPITIPERPTATGIHGNPVATTPAKEFNLSTSLPWQMPEQAFSYTESNGIPILNGFSKSFAQKKPRAEVKKCRKVYGLENRASWCTQCKWKKACTRFHERSSEGIS